MLYLIIVTLVCGSTSAQYWHHELHSTTEGAPVKESSFEGVTKATASSTGGDRLSGLYKSPSRKEWSDEDTTAKYSGPLALPPAYDKNGAPLPVLDTPEVAAEKAKHFALLYDGGSGTPFSSGYYYQPQLYDNFMLNGVSGNYEDANDSGYFGGTYYDNDEGSHYAAVSDYYRTDNAYRRRRKTRSLANNGFAATYTHIHTPLFTQHNVNGYHGSFAFGTGYDKSGAPLPVLDTPEVAAEKAKHLAIVAKERAWHEQEERTAGFEHDSADRRESYDGGFDDNGGGLSSFHGFGDDFGSSSIDSDNDWTPTSGPYGNHFNPIALPPGYEKSGAPLPVLDTPEVTAERAHHLAEFAKIADQHFHQHSFYV